jgi:hypothetical protein
VGPGHNGHTPCRHASCEHKPEAAAGSGAIILRRDEVRLLAGGVEQLDPLPPVPGVW